MITYNFAFAETNAKVIRACEQIQVFLKSLNVEADLVVVKGDNPYHTTATIKFQVEGKVSPTGVDVFLNSNKNLSLEGSDVLCHLVFLMKSIPSSWEEYAYFTKEVAEAEVDLPWGDYTFSPDRGYEIVGKFHSGTGIQCPHPGKLLSFKAGSYGWAEFYVPSSLVSVTKEDPEVVKAREEAEAEAELNAKLSEVNQHYAGWSFARAEVGCIVLVSPDGEEAKIQSHHSVWDYGDSSSDWLSIGGVHIS